MLALVEGLPPGSKFHASYEGDPALLGWGPLEHLVASLWDLGAQVNTDPKKTAPMYPRPGVKKKPQGGTPFLSMIGKSLGGD